jgi:hypothetical protein
MMVTNEIRREVMALAWRKLRWERDVTRCAYSLREALVHAWAWVKGAVARAVTQTAREARADNQIRHLRSPIVSPIRRALVSRPYAGALDHQAAYVTARLGY